MPAQYRAFYAGGHMAYVLEAGGFLQVIDFLRRGLALDHSQENAGEADGLFF